LVARTTSPAPLLTENFAFHLHLRTCGSIALDNHTRNPWWTRPSSTVSPRPPNGLRNAHIKSDKFQRLVHSSQHSWSLPVLLRRDICLQREQGDHHLSDRQRHRPASPQYSHLVLEPVLSPKSMIFLPTPPPVATTLSISTCVGASLRNIH
jgi:hypothetical protein